MGIVSKIGAWLDKRFPEKVNAADVMSEFLTLRAAVNKLSDDLSACQRHVMSFEDMRAQLSGLADLKDDVSKIKAIMQLKQKQSVEMPNLSGQTAWRR